MTESLSFTLFFCYELELSCFSGFFNRNCYSNSSTYHWVITHSDQTHHLYMGWYRRRSSELCITMHTSHCICHTIGSWSCSHVVRMKCTSCSSTRSYREVFLALLDTFFLICTCNRMLET